MADLGNSVEINAVPLNTWIMHFNYLGFLQFVSICYNSVKKLMCLYFFLSAPYSSSWCLDRLERSPEQDSTTGLKAIYFCVELGPLSVKGFSLVFLCFGRDSENGINQPLSLVLKYFQFNKINRSLFVTPSGTFSNEL